MYQKTCVLSFYKSKTILELSNYFCTISDWTKKKLFTTKYHILNHLQLFVPVETIRQVQIRFTSIQVSFKVSFNSTSIYQDMKK